MEWYGSFQTDADTLRNSQARLKDPNCFETCYRRKKPASIGDLLKRLCSNAGDTFCVMYLVNALSGAMDLCTTLVLTSSNKCERVVAHHALLKLRQLVRVDMPCRKQDGSHSAHFVRTAGCFFKDLNWRSLKCSGMPLAKWSKSSEWWHQDGTAPARTQLSHMIMYGYVWYGNIGNHKVAHLLYSTNFYHPTLRHSCGHLFFMTSPIHIKNWSVLAPTRQ